jgi:hypothetical protein
MNELERGIWNATFGAAYAQVYQAMRTDPNTRHPELYALHMAEHIALCAIEDMRAAGKLVPPDDDAALGDKLKGATDG